MPFFLATVFRQQRRHRAERQNSEAPLLSCNLAHPLELSASCLQCLHLHLQVIYISTCSISNEDITQYVLFFSELLTVSKNKIKVKSHSYN